MKCTLLLSLPFLLMVLACQKPTTLPTFEQILNKAAGVAEGQMTETQRPDYREGFLNGARMVEEAIKAGRKPFMPRLGEGPSQVRPLGPLPEGAEIIEDEPPVVEMDTTTGLQFRFVRADFTAAFARGQVDGFQWGLARHPAELLHPKAPPEWPSVWEPFPEKGGISLSGTVGEVDLIWAPGLLAWSIRERGFPSKRNWRPVPAWIHPTQAGLSEDAFWIDSEKGTLGLDLETGAIRRVGPLRPPMERLIPASGTKEERSEAEWEAFRKREQAKENAERPGYLEAAGKGDLEAMLKLGWGSADPAESVDWFRKAAEGGDAQAMMEMGTRLYQGRCVQKNLEEAKAWFQKAEKAGHPTAAEVLRVLFNNQ